MDISVVIPLYNEAESLPELEAWIRRVMEEHGFSYEIIFINDGSTDDSWRIIQELREKNPPCAGREVPSQLWEVPRPAMRLRPYPRRRGHHDGR